MILCIQILTNKTISLNYLYITSNILPSYGHSLLMISIHIIVIFIAYGYKGNIYMDETIVTFEYWLRMGNKKGNLTIYS